MKTTATTAGHHSEAARSRAEAGARLQRERERPLPGWLSTRRSRRALALLPVAPFVLGILSATAESGVPSALLLGAASLAGSTGVLWLRRATRWLDNAPAALLDEREVLDRDRAYRNGFRLVLVLLGALTLLAFVDGVFVQETGEPVFDGIGWFPLAFGSLLSAVMLPSAALAWTWRAPVGEGDD